MARASQTVDKFDRATWKDWNNLSNALSLRTNVDKISQRRQTKSRQFVAVIANNSDWSIPRKYSFSFLWSYFKPAFIVRE